jgi:hypothetical protein
VLSERGKLSGNNSIDVIFEKRLKGIPGSLRIFTEEPQKAIRYNIPDF